MEPLVTKWAGCMTTFQLCRNDPGSWRRFGSDFHFGTGPLYKLTFTIDNICCSFSHYHHKRLGDYFTDWQWILKGFGSTSINASVLVSINVILTLTVNHCLVNWQPTHWPLKAEVSTHLTCKLKCYWLFIWT